MPTPEQDGKYLSAIKSPMLFNAFSIISVGSIATATAITGHTSTLQWVSIAWIVAMTIWVNWQSIHDPRALTYGPREYLEESRLSHQRHMAALRAQNSKSGKSV
jgi:hypothetical protein